MIILHQENTLIWFLYHQKWLLRSSLTCWFCMSQCSYLFLLLIHKWHLDIAFSTTSLFHLAEWNSNDHEKEIGFLFIFAKIINMTMQWQNLLVLQFSYHNNWEEISLIFHGKWSNLQELSLFSFPQGAIDTATLETRIKVVNPEDPEPSINLYVEDQADPAMRLVSEMMILCGEAIAAFGSQNNIPLPYRGQPQSNIDLSAFSHLPEGPVRSFAILRILRGAEIDFRKPIRHGVLGLPGYVQFTSPIRRYMDLIAHYQVSESGTWTLSWKFPLQWHSGWQFFFKKSTWVIQYLENLPSLVCPSRQGSSGRSYPFDLGTSVCFVWRVSI